jgi:hypothetical protein
VAGFTIFTLTKKERKKERIVVDTGEIKRFFEVYNIFALFFEKIEKATVPSMR